MATDKKSKFTVISNTNVNEVSTSDNIEYHSNPFYEKLLQFRNLQEQQKKRFSPDDLFKLC